MALNNNKGFMCIFVFTCQEVKNGVEVQLLPDLTAETMLGWALTNFVIKDFGCLKHMVNVSCFVPRMGEGC